MHTDIITLINEDSGMFRQIPVSIVRLDHVYDFDLYLKISNAYHLFAARGVPLTMDHLAWISHREMRFYVRRDEWDAALKAIEQDIWYILGSPGVPDAHKADLIYSSAMRSLTETYQGDLPRTIADVQRYADEEMKQILSDGNVLDNLWRMTAEDHFTFRHSIRVGILATALLQRLVGDRISKARITGLCTGFFLHDIGMTEVPMEIIEKPGRLSDRERGLVRMHPLWGRDRILNARVLSPEAVSIILSHHERIDGSGYPYRKRGDEISLYARICTLADTFEALTAERPYHKPLTPFAALRAMHEGMSHDFDPELFVAFVKLLGPEA